MRAYKYSVQYTVDMGVTTMRPRARARAKPEVEDDATGRREYRYERSVNYPIMRTGVAVTELGSSVVIR